MNFHLEMYYHTKSFKHLFCIWTCLTYFEIQNHNTNKHWEYFEYKKLTDIDNSICHKFRIIYQLFNH